MSGAPIIKSKVLQWDVLVSPERTDTIDPSSASPVLAPTIDICSAAELPTFTTLFETLCRQQNRNPASAGQRHVFNDNLNYCTRSCGSLDGATSALFATVYVVPAAAGAGAMSAVPGSLSRTLRLQLAQQSYVSAISFLL